MNDTQHNINILVLTNIQTIVETASGMNILNE
jgi:hypothetical protein